jgi:hypothetical protein
MSPPNTPSVEQMRQEAIAAGKLAMFDRLREFLVEAPEPEQYAGLAIELRMRRNAVAVTVHRLRERLKERVRAELLETVRDPRDVDLELRVLRRTLVDS